MQDKLPVVVPDPCYIAPDGAYFGYPKLNGDLLAQQWAGFSSKDRRQLHKQWVNIAAAIHSSLSVRQARQWGVPNFEVVLDTAEKIFEMVDLDEWVLQFARTLLTNARAEVWKGKEVVIHNDLQFQNLLIDSETRRITGVIDWTDICIGPLEREFAMWEGVGSKNLEQVAELYFLKTGNRLNVRQARILRQIEELSDYVENVKAGQVDGAAESLLAIQ